jgi:hypothetical protein
MDIISSIFKFLFVVLFVYWLWVPIAIVLFYRLIKRQLSIKDPVIDPISAIIMNVIIPKDNDKKELSAEQMFAGLHGILKEAHESSKHSDRFSVEIASQNGTINFYIWAPKHLASYIEGQIYAHYPSVQIKTLDKDYMKIGEGLSTQYREMVLIKDHALPIRTFLTFDVDPLASITNAMSKFAKEETFIVQYIMEPIADDWHKLSKEFAVKVKNKKQGFFLRDDGKLYIEPLRFAVDLIRSFWKPVDYSLSKEESALSSEETTMISAAQSKAEKLGYRAQIRLIYQGNNNVLATNRMQAMVGSFKQYNTTNLNGFKAVEYPINWNHIIDRTIDREGGIFNTEELASLFHFPHTSVETPNITWIATKVSEPPVNLPTLDNTAGHELSILGHTNFRETHTRFGIKRYDRPRHLYIIGKSGVGKSGLLTILSISDIFHNHGFAVIDPHGDLAQDIMGYIPRSRADDVVYFNPADLEYPISFNPMEISDPNLRPTIASEIVAVLSKMFDSWGPRLENLLRFTLLALLEYPESTMLDITRMLTDKKFRDEVIKYITDPIVKNFWVQEFNTWNDKYAQEAVSPVLNKVGQFTANPLVRNLIGQPKSSFDIRHIMDHGKILIADLSRGKIGEDNANILGALMITKIQLSAMSRAYIPLEKRRPFYLYVDEFQNFATNSFAVILSESRKFGLYLTVANQYISQMSEEVRNAVFGNVGSIITYRVGVDDAEYLSKYFSPSFSPADLQNLSLRHICVSISINGEVSIPFSATTLDLPPKMDDSLEYIIGLSRAKYAKPRAEVEKIILESLNSKNNPNNKPSQSSMANNNPIPAVSINHSGSSNHHKNEQPLQHNPEVSINPKLAGIVPKNYSQMIPTQSQQSSNSNQQHRNSNNNNPNQNNDRNNSSNQNSNQSNGSNGQRRRRRR